MDAAPWLSCLWIDRLLGTADRLLGTGNRLLGTGNRLLGTGQVCKLLIYKEKKTIFSAKTLKTY